MSKKPLIIDCDPGVDDAVMLMMALASPDLDVRAITAVAGNVPLSLTSRNARMMCDLMGRTDIPVFAGCSRPMVRPPSVIVGRTGGMGQCRPSAARRHGARDGIPSGLSRACVVCASSLSCVWPCCSPASMVCEHCAARHVERPPGQGARVGCTQGGHTRPSTRVAAAFARSGPPASMASDASRGPLCMQRECVQ